MIASFGQGHSSFKNVDFGDGDISFIRVSFGRKGADFSSAKFGRGRVSMAKTHFEGGVIFNGAEFKSESVDFTYASISNIASFDQVRVSPACRMFSFEKSTLSGPFSLSFENLNGSDATFETRFVPDLTGSQSTHHVELHNLHCKPQGIRGGSAEQANALDAPRLCRLKELAENNKDHEAALRFHADEMRVKRWSATPKAASILDWLFDLTSLYGQSIWRPFAGLVATVLLLTVVAIAGSPYELSWLTLVEGFTFSLGKAIPFVGSIAGDSGVAAKALGLPSWYAPISFVFSLLSFVFLFLIGLGLRNRFRI